MTITQLDRTIEKLIKDTIISKGYLSAYTGDKVAYKAANDAIRAGGDSLIEVFGVGSNSDRKDLQPNRITVNRESLLPSLSGGFDIGTSPLGGLHTTSYEEYVDGGAMTKFRKLKNVSRTVNIIYHIRTLTNTTKYERICLEALLETFDIHSYVPVLNSDYTALDNDTLVLVEVDNYSDLTTRMDLKEMLLIIHAKDVCLQYGNNVLLDDIAPLTEVHNIVHDQLPDDETLVDTITYRTDD